MSRSGEEVDVAAESTAEDPVFLKQRLSFSRGRNAAGEEILVVDCEVEPGGGVTPHIHPSVHERFEVLAGTPSFLGGRRWRQRSPGDVVDVPPGTRHAYRNDGDEVALIRCEASPPSTLQEFLEDAAGLGRSGAFGPFGIPKGPAAALKGVALAHRHREMVLLLFPPMPPPFLQRLLFPAVARLAERRGHRPGTFKDAP